jgi:hypothetical protein
MSDVFVREGGYLALFIPANARVLVFRVRSVYNRGFHDLNYGPLPLRAGMTLPLLTGGTVTVPADGVLPAMAVAGPLSVPMPGVVEETDMWFVRRDMNDRLFHVHQYITPAWVRVELQIPIAVRQRRFQKDKLIIGVERLWGYNRGYIEVFHIPEVRYGYVYANDTNLNVYTNVRFRYAEYEVEIPRSPELIFDIITGRVPAYWYTVPVTTMDRAFEQALLQSYGFTGFNMYRHDERARAVAEIGEALRGVRL